jgi:glutaredoxin 3
MDVKEVIEQHSGSVFFFSRDVCPYCDKLANDLDHLKIPFIKITIPKDDHNAKEQLVSITQLKTFPQLYIGQTFVGGYDAFVKLIMTNQLGGRLAPLGISINEDDF